MNEEREKGRHKGRKEGLNGGGRKEKEREVKE